MSVSVVVVIATLETFRVKSLLHVTIKWLLLTVTLLYNLLPNSPRLLFIFSGQ